MRQPLELTPARGAWLWLAMALCAGLAPMPARAATLSEQGVRAAAQTWVRKVLHAARTDAVVERMEPYAVDGVVVAYIAHLQDRGYCICAADDRLLPVYMYCPDGHYDPAGESARIYLNAVKLETAQYGTASHLRAAELASLRPMFEKRQQYWQSLASGVLPARQLGTYDGPAVVQLHTKTLWDQKYPYNTQCPWFPWAGSPCKTGCVANAMGAILKYWEWPNTGVGKDTTIAWYRHSDSWKYSWINHDPGIGSEWAGYLSYTVTDSGGRLGMQGNWDRDRTTAAVKLDTTASYQAALYGCWVQMQQTDLYQYADFGATTYDWSMIDSIYSSSSDPAHIAAVAQLLHHAGIAQHMDYGTSGSGANSSPSAYVDHFRYSSDADHVEVPEAQFAARKADMLNDITEDLQWMRLVDYGAGAPWGHEWYIGGYDRTGMPDSLMFLWNDGNGGTQPGVNYSIYWGLLPSLDKGNSCGYHRYVAPANVVRFVGGGFWGYGTPRYPYADATDAFTYAPDGTTLIFKAGSSNLFSGGSLTLSRPMTLKGVQATIQKAP